MEDALKKYLSEKNNIPKISPLWLKSDKNLEFDFNTSPHTLLTMHENDHERDLIRWSLNKEVMKEIKKRLSK